MADSVRIVQRNLGRFYPSPELLKETKVFKKSYFENLEYSDPIEKMYFLLRDDCLIIFEVRSGGLCTIYARFYKEGGTPKYENWISSLELPYEEGCEFIPFNSPTEMINGTIRKKGMYTEAARKIWYSAVANGFIKIKEFQNVQ